MRIRLTSKAQKELDKINVKIALRISRKIYQLGEIPYGLGSQKLEGGRGYRIRIGDYRVIYTVNKERKTILIIKIGTEERFIGDTHQVSCESRTGSVH